MSLERLQQLAGIKLTESVVAEKAPKGWEGTVKGMKKHKEIDNPWALAHWMKKQGYKSHKKEESVDIWGEGLEEKAPPGMEDLVLKLKKQYPDDHSKAFATAWSIYNKKHGKADEAVMGVGPGYVEEEINGTPDVDTCRQDNPANCRDACHMEESINESFSIGAKVYPAHDQTDPPFEIVDVIDDQRVEVVDDYGNREVMLIKDLVPAGIDDHDYPEEPGDDAGTDFDDPNFPVDGSAGSGQEDISPFSDAFDEDYVEEAFDLNNGYDDVNDANPQDYFPTGADSPVITAIGGGAKQGDNPEQKKFQTVKETSDIHKELVYRYRGYLNESNQKKN